MIGGDEVVCVLYVYALEISGDRTESWGFARENVCSGLNKNPRNALCFFLLVFVGFGNVGKRPQSGPFYLGLGVLFKFGPMRDFYS